MKTKRDIALAVKAAVNEDPDAYGLRYGISLRTVTDLLDEILDVMKELMIENDRLFLNGFGTFKKSVRKGREFVHPLTKAYKIIPDKEYLKFVPARGFINGTVVADDDAEDVDNADADEEEAADENEE